MSSNYDNLVEGWNLISISDNRYTDPSELAKILPDEFLLDLNSIYTFNNGEHVKVTSLELNKGYWVKVNKNVEEDFVAKSTNTIKINNKTYTYTLKKYEDGKTSYYDEDNNMEISETEYLSKLSERRRSIYKYGKIHPRLGLELEKLSDRDTINIKVWKVINSNFNLDDKLNFSNAYELFLRKNDHINIPNKDNFTDITSTFLKTNEGAELYSKLNNRQLSLDSMTVTKSSIFQLALNNSVVGIFKRDDSAFEDINNQKNDTNATIIVDTEGWRGTNLRACVFEGSPGDQGTLSGFNLVNNNVDPDGQQSGIQESFTGVLPGTRNHATTVTSIITNRGTNVSQQGYAPDSLIYSANNYTLESLTWAVQEKHCRVVNQSFHRSSEWDSPIPLEDDIYRDYLVLQFPYPFITTASGNWAQNHPSEPGGVDGSLEFVNHKSYNAVTVGNNNDFVGGNPNGMAGSSVWKNPDSAHGDWELPEICANGTSVFFNNQNRGGGTSYASPAVAGTALLLQNADNILLYWPEGIRAILFAGAIQNIRDNNWSEDVKNNLDGYDGCGCIDTEESMRITIKSFNSGKRNPNNTPKPRGWDVGTLSDNDFKEVGSYISYYIGVPNIDPSGNNSKTSRIKVALAWNSQISMDQDEPISSTLNLDHDLYLYNEAGFRVAHSASWDNSYEVIDFEGLRGQIYEIRIKRWSGTGSTWYGIAWTSGNGSFMRFHKYQELNNNHVIQEVSGYSGEIILGIPPNMYRQINPDRFDLLWRDTVINSKYLLDYDSIFTLSSTIKHGTELIMTIDPSKLDKCITNSPNYLENLRLFCSSNSTELINNYYYNRRIFNLSLFSKILNPFSPNTVTFIMDWNIRLGETLSDCMFVFGISKEDL